MPDMTNPLQKKWTEVDDYIASLLIPPDAALDGALKASDEAGLPPINVSANQGKLLMLFARMLNARNILEIGTLGGYSTIWMARGMAEGGRLITLEYEAKHAEVATANLVRAGLSGRVEIRVGRAGDTLPKLVEEGRGPFDLVFIDADKQGYTEYLEWSMKLSRRGTVIVADNVVRNGAITDEASSDEMVQGIRRFNRALAAEKRVSATEIQTVGSKGYDGLAIATVIADI
jgi:predicted O-methyltransferase YrrM